MAVSLTPAREASTLKAISHFENDFVLRQLSAALTLNEAINKATTATRVPTLPVDLQMFFILEA